MMQNGLAKCILAFFVILFFSCKKDTQVLPAVNEPDITSEKTLVKFNFNALFNNEPLVFNRTKLYTNLFGDSLNVSTFKYYISNIKLTDSNGSVYSEPESYHLIKHNEITSTTFTIANLPEGNYTKIEFLIGVDSTRNMSGAQSGDLDPSNLMFWDWNQGYIFFKIEGNYKSVTQTALTDYMMHIGGFSGTLNCIRKCTFDIAGSQLRIKKGKTATVFYTVTVDEVFKNPTVLGFDNYFNLSPNKSSGVVANNYMDMFSVEKIEN